MKMKGLPSLIPTVILVRRFKISGRIFLNWMKMKRVYVLLTPLVDRRK